MPAVRPRSCHPNPGFPLIHRAPLLSKSKILILPRTPAADPALNKVVEAPFPSPNRGPLAPSC